MRRYGPYLLRALLMSACFIGLSAVLSAADPVVAEEAISPREALKLPTKKYYDQMLELTKNGDYEAIDPLLDEMKPVFDYLKTEYHYDAESAIRHACDQHNPNLIRSAVHAAVFRDVQALLQEAAGHSRNSLRAARTDIRIARLTYEIVSANVRKGDLIRDERIKKYFVDAYRLANTDSPYSRGGESGNGQLTALLKNISLEIKGVTPVD